MSFGKIAAIIFGILIVLLGVHCIAAPAGTYTALAVFAGVAMLFEGITNLCGWATWRGTPLSTPVPLVAGVISVVLGIALLFSWGAQMAFDLMIAYMIAFWAAFAGVVRIIGSLQLRNTVVNDTHWGMQMAFGVVLLVIGILCFANPMISLVAVSYMIGISVIAAGLAVASAAVLV